MLQDRPALADGAAAAENDMAVAVPAVVPGDVAGESAMDIDSQAPPITTTNK